MNKRKKSLKENAQGCFLYIKSEGKKSCTYYKGVVILDRYLVLKGMFNLFPLIKF